MKFHNRLGQQGVDKLFELTVAIPQLAMAKNALSKEIDTLTYQHILTAKELEGVGKVQKENSAKTKEDNSVEQSTMPTSVADMVHNVDSVPRYRKVLADNGLTPREYVIVMLTLTRVSSAAMHNKFKRYAVNPKNIEFARKHQAEIDKIVAASWSE